jgi:hemin uptake protein HemP
MIAAEDQSVSGHEKTDSGEAHIAPRAVAHLPEYDTRTLFEGGREIVIHHAGAAYRMKITKQGKLILNK